MAGLKDAYPLTTGVLQASDADARKNFAKGEYLKGAGALARGAFGGIGGVIADTANSAVGASRGLAGLGAKAFEGFMGGAKVPELVAEAVGAENPPTAAPAAPGLRTSADSSARQNGLDARGPTLRAGYTTQPTSVSGITRVNGGSSPLFTNIDPATAVAEIDRMRPGQVQFGNGVDLGASNTGLARANAIRGSIGAGQGGAPGGGAIGSSNLGDGVAERWGREAAVKQALAPISGANGITANQRATATQMMEQGDNRDLRSAALAQNAAFKSGDQALEAQKLRQLDEMGLRRDAIDREKLGLDREQFAAAGGLRDAQRLNYLADAQSKLNPKRDNTSGSKVLDGAIEGYFTGEDGKLDKASATAFRSYVASQPLDIPGLGRMSLAQAAAIDPEVAHRMLPSVLANYDPQKKLEAREGGLLPPAEAKGIRGMQSGDRVGFTEGLWGRATGKQVVDYGDGRVVPLDDVDPQVRNLLKNNLAR